VLEALALVASHTMKSGQLRGAVMAALVQADVPERLKNLPGPS